MRQVVYYVLQYFYFNSLLSTYYSELEQILYINYYTRPPACHMKWIAFFSQTDLTFLKGGQIQPSVNVEHTSSEAGKIPEAQLTAQNCQNLCILFKSFYMCIQA